MRIEEHAGAVECASEERIGVRAIVVWIRNEQWPVDPRRPDIRTFDGAYDVRFDRDGPVGSTARARMPATVAGVDVEAES
jgi:hypothetical protein